MEWRGRKFCLVIVGFGAEAKLVSTSEYGALGAYLEF